MAVEMEAPMEVYGISHDFSRLFPRKLPYYVVFHSTVVETYVPHTPTEASISSVHLYALLYNPLEASRLLPRIRKYARTVACTEIGAAVACTGTPACSSWTAAILGVQSLL